MTLNSHYLHLFRLLARTYCRRDVIGTDRAVTSTRTSVWKRRRNVGQRDKRWTQRELFTLLAPHTMTTRPEQTGSVSIQSDIQELSVHL